MTDDLLAQQPQDDLPKIDDNKDYYQELVGEGKKFQDNKALARGKYESDAYIEVLKRRLDEMRNDYMKLNENVTAGANLKELIDQLKTQQSTESKNTPMQQEVETNTPTIDPNKIREIFSSEYQKQKQEEKDRANFSQVKEKLQEQFGSNYQSVLNERIAELGLTPEDVNNLAKKSPTAFFRTMGLENQVKDTFQAPARSTQRTDSFSPRVEKHTMSWYKKTYGNDPKIYYDKKITAQMNKDAVELGAAFFDTPD